MLKQIQKLEVGKNAFRPYMMSWVTLKALFFFFFLDSFMYMRFIFPTSYKSLSQGQRPDFNFTQIFNNP